MASPASDGPDPAPSEWTGRQYSGLLIDLTPDGRGEGWLPQPRQKQYLYCQVWAGSIRREAEWEPRQDVGNGRSGSSKRQTAFERFVRGMLKRPRTESCQTGIVRFSGLVGERPTRVLGKTRGGPGPSRAHTPTKTGSTPVPATR